MRKIIIVILIFSVLFVSCSNTTTSMQSDISSGQSESKIDEATFNYEQALIDFLGEDYFEGKAIMRSDDTEIEGEMVAVFKVGINTQEKFTTEQWLAVNTNGVVYIQDIILAQWFVMPDVNAIKACMYALSDVLGEVFIPEHNFNWDEEKYAVFKTEEEANTPYSIPSMLINMGKAMPSGYFEDPSFASFYPVSNFSSKEDIYEYLSLYFTKSFISEQMQNIEDNFLEFDGGLYLVRGGRGYGYFNIDLDTINYQSIQNDILLVDFLAGGEAFGYAYTVFDYEDGVLKIDDFYDALTYNFSNLIPEIGFSIHIIDFYAFVNDAELTTNPNLFELSDDGVYKIIYQGDYSNDLENYIACLKQLGFIALVDGYEGYYQLEKYEDEFSLTVTVYHLNGDEAIALEISVVEAMG